MHCCLRHQRLPASLPNSFPRDDLGPNHLKVSTILHPSTYLNKVLFGSRQGRLQLWNLRTRKMIFEFPGWGSAVTCLTQSPAVDVVAVGLEDGRIMLHNLKQNVTLMSFHQDGGPVTSMSFRTDETATLASASASGSIAIWDLEKRQLDQVITEAHEGAVVSVCFLLSQAMMVSTGTDNAVKIWIFDETGGEARLLRSRCGHHAPPTKVRYYSDDGRSLLSSGQDRTLRSFNILADSQTVELSQGSVVKKSKQLKIKAIELKLPTVTDFAAEHARERDWDNIVTCHQREVGVRTWTYQSKRIGKHTLKHPAVESAGGIAKVVEISGCGNFALVGYTTGHVLKYNLQSGKCRGAFGGNVTGTTSKEEVFGMPVHASKIAGSAAALGRKRTKAHTEMVRGIACDALNKYAVTGSQDGTVKFWGFQKGNLVKTNDLGAPVVHMCMHRESGLIAVACSDYTISVLDIDTHKKVRMFRGHTNRITDMTWSGDGRWLISASMDATVRTWDMPTGRAISWFGVADAVTSVSMSPTGDFLATTHVGSLGIFLWANRSLFGAVSLTPLDDKAGAAPEVLMMPRTSGRSAVTKSSSSGGGAAGGVAATDAEDSDAAQGDNGEDDDGDDGEDGGDDVIALGSGLVTFSSLPKSRWANLSHLADIRRRNKPKEAPKAPKHAPFFLPTIAGLAPEFDVTGGAPELGEGTSKVLNFGKIGVKSPFQQALCDAGECEDYSAFLAKLMGMGPSALDLEIRSLSLENDVEQLRYFLQFVSAQLQERSQFELVQSYMHLFLNVHGETIAASPHLLDIIKTVTDAQNLSWIHIEGLFQHSLCVLSFLRGAM